METPQSHGTCRASIGNPFQYLTFFKARKYLLCLNGLLCTWIQYISISFHPVIGYKQNGIVSWKEPSRIAEFNCLTSPGLIKRRSTLLRAQSKSLLNINRQEALTTSLGSIFQCSSAFTIKKFFLMFDLTLLVKFCDIPMHPAINSQKQSPAPHSVLLLLRSCR